MDGSGDIVCVSGVHDDCSAVYLADYRWRGCYGYGVISDIAVACIFVGYGDRNLVVFLV